MHFVMMQLVNLLKKIDQRRKKGHDQPQQNIIQNLLTTSYPGQLFRLWVHGLSRSIAVP